MPKRRPLTTRRSASYDRIHSLLVFHEENWSDLGVSRSRPMPLNRLGILVSAGILCLWAATRPARAAGCHVPDRPVLGTTLSWEQEGRVELCFPRAALAPPVLSHPPCPGEVPHVL